ncbi:glucokinase [Falsirhodobacter halotolerans]|uniref:glucokinase n=1 Tax=Falsirhodobacter halotolerans TaxID=1146892 RepID=UPI001FD464E6|nr:glucokinase [Falsirhodobacter halotolerans]MCJ8139701.1 glucokinase [Falsirhodobacter halotolerans]
MPGLSLVADVGGTNSRIALAEDSVLRPDTIRRFPNAEFAGIETVIARYLDELGVRIDAACLAVAGPVSNGVAHLTNRDWTIDGARIAAATGAARVMVLNDLQAQGFALPHVAAEALRTVVPGRPAPVGAPRMVVGVGTGLNVAAVHYASGGVVVPPAEAGHITLPVQTAEDLRLADYLTTHHGVAKAEEALSGRGISALHGFLTGTPKPSDQIIPAIGTDPEATETARLFLRLLATFVGDMALVHLPTGGIALCGGMARAFTPHFEPLGFRKAFLDKGDFAALLESMPVQVLEDDYAALIGCAAAIR